MDENIDHFTTIVSKPRGAHFFRADLHLHCFGGSHDVSDAAMTPAAVVAAALADNLSILAVTDHNEILNVEAAIVAAKGQPVLIVPAVELSTPQGHLLCYFETLPNLRKFYGRLNVKDGGHQNSRCQQSIIECLDLMNELGGFGILAHVDGPSGFDVQVPGASPHKLDVLAHPALLGIELKHANSSISYTSQDPDAARRQLGVERSNRHGSNTPHALARVLNSDAHTLAALGRNAANARKVTRYKMDAPSFSALRIALQDADARVRIEEQVPDQIPHIVGIYLDGGFLTGQSIHFSRNLNCIIGGRGTGKSTAFEALRQLMIPADAATPSADLEVWPDASHLLWQDQSGQLHKLTRRRDEAVVNVEDPHFGPTSFEIDCFGQGEAQQVSLKAQEDPQALQRYLDRFIGLKEALEGENKARDELLRLQTEIEQAEQQVNQIPVYERLLTTAKQQLTALKKPDVKELIELQQHLSHEKTLRKQIADNMATVKKDICVLGSRKAVKKIRTLADAKVLTVGQLEYQTISKGAGDLETSLIGIESSIKTNIEAFDATVVASITDWQVKEATAQERVDKKRRELETLNVSFDMSYITKLAQDEATHQQSVSNLKSWKPHLAALKTQRNDMLLQRWRTRARVSTLRAAFATKASDALRDSLTDLNVSLKYTANALSPEGSEQVINAMGWRTNQQPRAAWLVQNLTIPALLDAIKAKDKRPILQIATPEGVPVFKSPEAVEILERLGAPAIRYALERVALHDLPKLQITKEVPDSKSGKRFVTRDFSKLSLGQQQSVLLALMLSGESNRPLIIDQPEDNLDGEFIYSTLVPILRRAKERRQVIVVTHNANVAILGDAEQVIVMKAGSEKGEVSTRGSIDHPLTRDAACGILEGAKEAFVKRAKIYGVL